MTTQDYIELVDRVVGTKGSLKVPAYWMNRLMKESTKMIEDVVKNIDLSNYPTWDQADENYAFRYEFENLNNYVYNTLAGKVSTNTSDITILKSSVNDHSTSISNLWNQKLSTYTADQTYATKTSVDQIINELSYTYPQNATIEGPSLCTESCEYTWTTTTGEVNGNFSLLWTVDFNNVVLENSTNDICKITPVDVNEPETAILTLKFTKKYNNEVFLEVTKTISIAQPDVIITSTSNAPIQASLYAAGLVANENYTLLSEAEAITAEQLQPGTSSSTSIFYAQKSNITHFEEFEHFTGVTSVRPYLFYDSALKTIFLPETITSIHDYALCANLTYGSLKIKGTINEIGSRAFANGTVILRNAYVDSLDQWLQSPYSNVSTEYLYIRQEDGTYALCTNPVIPDTITNLRTYAFAYMHIDSIYIPESVTYIDKYALWNSGYTTKPLKIFNARGVSSLNSTQRSDNDDVILSESVPFGFFTYPNSTAVYAEGHPDCFVYGYATLMLGETKFCAKEHYLFDNDLSEKTITLSYTGGWEDLTGQFKIVKRALTVNSNIPDVEFSISYTDSDGESVSSTILAGQRYYLKVNEDTQITIKAVTDVDDYKAPADKTVSLSSTYVYSMNYTEKVDLYIQHTDGNLYTSEEWTAGGYSNDNANGVTVVRPFSGSFVIAKEDVGTSTLAWGGYNKTITGIATTYDSATAAKDNTGINNTPKIISQLSDYTDSKNITGAPAAEACANYTFPNGLTGYLGALGEWKAAYGNKTSIASLMNQIGGTAINTSNYYWTSTQYSSYTSWYFGWSNSYVRYSDKSYTYYVRAFSAPLSLSINCNRTDVEFQVTYTKFRNGGEKTVTLKPGIHNTVVPQSNTTVTISVAPGYEWAEMDVNTQTFTYTGSPITATFVAGVGNGVYIQHTNGTLYTTTEWTDGGYSNDTANGVAVIDSTSCSFVIAKENAGTSLAWGGYNKTITDIVTSTSSSTAVLDFDGEGNTTKIIEQLTDYTDSYSVTGAPAAEACDNYTFPNGSKGYLPSLGEWYAAYNNKTAIVEAMSLIGGTAIALNNYWTSTQNSSLGSWSLGWTLGRMSYTNKYTTSYVRAFSAL